MSSQGRVETYVPDSIFDGIFSQIEFSLTKQNLSSFFSNDVWHSPNVKVLPNIFLLNTKPLQAVKSHTFSNVVFPIFLKHDSTHLDPTLSKYISNKSRIKFHEVFQNEYTNKDGCLRLFCNLWSKLGAF